MSDKPARSHLCRVFRHPSQLSWLRRHHPLVPRLREYEGFIGRLFLLRLLADGCEWSVDAGEFFASMFGSKHPSDAGGRDVAMRLPKLQFRVRAFRDLQCGARGTAA